VRQQHPKLFSLKERNFFFFSSLRILVSKANIQQHLKSKLNKIKTNLNFKNFFFFLILHALPIYTKWS